MSPAAPLDEAGAGIIERLTMKYQFAGFTNVSATEAATVLTKAELPPAWESGRPLPRFERTSELELPRALRGEFKPTAADIGTATHLVLQHLDFRRPCTAEDLKEQLDELINRKLITEREANSINAKSICWVASSAIGKMIREGASDVRRELPLYFAMNVDELKSTDPEDRVMVRSRIDVLLRTSRGLEIVDYKTDRLSAEMVEARAEAYRPQVDFYRRAVEAITRQTGEKVAAVHLVFLDPQVIHTT